LLFGSFTYHTWQVCNQRHTGPNLSLVLSCLLCCTLCTPAGHQVEGPNFWLVLSCLSCCTLCNPAGHQVEGRPPTAAHTVLICVRPCRDGVVAGARERARKLDGRTRQRRERAEANDGQPLRLPPVVARECPSLRAAASSHPCGPHSSTKRTISVHLRAPL